MKDSNQPYSIERQLQRNSGPPAEVGNEIAAFLQQQKAEAKLSSYVPAIRQRGYGKKGEAELWAQKFEMLVRKGKNDAGSVPAHLTNGFRLVAKRKAGRRIGQVYGLVTQAELFEKCAYLIPTICAVLGVPFDRNYLAQTGGLVHHLQQNFAFITLEEIESFATAFYMIPPEAIPTAYQVFHIQAAGMLVRAYVKHVFGKQAGPASQWLKVNCITEGEKEAAAKRRELEAIDPRYRRHPELLANFPPDVQARLQRAYTETPELIQLTFKGKRAAAHKAAAEDAEVLADYVTACLLTISKPMLEKIGGRIGKEFFEAKSRNTGAVGEAFAQAGAYQSVLNLALYAQQLAEWQQLGFGAEDLPTPTPITEEEDE